MFPTDKKTSEAASRALSADQGASVPVDARTSGASSAKASLTPEKSPVVKEIEQLGIPYHPSTSHAQAQAKLTECKEANGKVKRDNYIVYENEGQFYLCSTHVTTDWVGNYLQAKAVDSVSFPVCKISLTDEGWKFEGDGFRFFKSNEPYPSLSNLIERNFKDKTAI